MPLLVEMIVFLSPGWFCSRGAVAVSVRIFFSHLNPSPQTAGEVAVMPVQVADSAAGRRVEPQVRSPTYTKTNASAA